MSWRSICHNVPYPLLISLARAIRRIGRASLAALEAAAEARLEGQLAGWGVVRPAHQVRGGEASAGFSGFAKTLIAEHQVRAGRLGPAVATAWAPADDAATQMAMAMGRPSRRDHRRRASGLQQAIVEAQIEAEARQRRLAGTAPGGRG